MCHENPMERVFSAKNPPLIHVHAVWCTAANYGRGCV